MKFENLCFFLKFHAVAAIMALIVDDAVHGIHTNEIEQLRTE